MTGIAKNPIEIINLRFSGMVAWNVVNSHGSFISMHFGTPRLRVSDVTENNVLIRRTAHVFGDGELWIYISNWNITHNDSVVATSNDSSDIITKAMRLIQGQRLINVSKQFNKTCFQFDLNTKIIIRGSNQMEPQWIFSIDGHVFYEHLG